MTEPGPPRLSSAPGTESNAKARTGAPEISVVIPAYNERSRLPRTLDEILPFLTGRFRSFEVIVVDDGSSDGTGDEVREKVVRHPEVRLLTQPVNLGKGAAVRRGCLEARGDFVLFMDADHATPIASVNAFLAAWNEHHPQVVNGVRTYQVEESRFRRIVGLMGLLIAHLIVFRSSIIDSQCGFKMFTREAVRKIFPYCRLNSCLFDVEIFYLIHKFGISSRFVAVEWENKAGSRINIPGTVIGGPLEMIWIRLFDRFGGYAKPVEDGKQPWVR